MIDRPTLNGCAFTIVNHAYLPFALTLAHSFTDHHPNRHFYIFLVEQESVGLPNVGQPVDRTTIININEVGIPDFVQRAFYYEVTELCTSIKPECALYLIAQGWSKVVYLDPDIFVYRELSEIFDGLNRQDIIITPHTVVPMTDEYTPNELDLLKTGAYNLGFMAVAGRDDGLRFLKWWADRLRFAAHVAFDSGLFTDQKWVDLVPSYFDRVWICKIRTLNVAYWNLHERGVTRDGDLYRVDGQPLGFFHFSGVDIRTPTALSKYQNRVDLAREPALSELVTAYCQAVQAWPQAVRPYSYGHYLGGRRIEVGERRLYLHYLLRGQGVADPFTFQSFTELAARLTPRPLVGVHVTRDPVARLDGLLRRLRPWSAVLPRPVLQALVLRSANAVRGAHYLSNPRRWYYVAAGLLARHRSSDD